MNLNILRCLVAVTALGLTVPGLADDDVQRLVAAMLGDTPVIDDLHELTDTIGARPTGSDANRRAVEWAARKFRQAELTVSTEDFTMPVVWQENFVTASIDGDASFEIGAVAKPFSAAAIALEASLLDAGLGTPENFQQLGDAASGAWLLVETPILDDVVGLAGLFKEYEDAVAIETRAADARAAGVAFMSSRPKNLLFRHNAGAGIANALPLLVLEREQAQRALRLLRSGQSLQMTGSIGAVTEANQTATNVIAEIPGNSRAEEIVLFGAHLDSHDLGTGALDNGVNVVMLINVARQLTRLGLRPERTIRFALWNGEEQGLVGSWKYTEQHESELDNHIVAASFDIGSGRTTGFFTGGRPDLVRLVDLYLAPVAGLGPFQQIDIPLVGTDNFDFMIEGVPNLIAIQSDANYASNYHAESDTFDKVDQHQLRLNSAIAAAVIWGFANDAARLPRMSQDEIAALIDGTDLEQQMRNMAVWDGWANGMRGRR
ncbi:MAG: M28 family peptidase [Gammaproteobacteria bacterium]|nr:M28 family peptidase [Gammaproteobacteria bacterium]MDH5304565.1 M28 family peptidase [Gammaproteobacteria bacterium]MDH5322571.1 M28 family peptidase [Gammaproteobacteria bacterium]